MDTLLGSFNNTPNGEDTVRELVEKYLEVRDRRRALEALAKELKAGEEAQQEKLLLQWLTAQGVSSIKVPQLGTLAKKTVTHYEIRESERLCHMLLGAMLKASRDGKLLSDVLFFQRRISRDVFESFLKRFPEEQYESLLATSGVALVGTDSLTFSRSTK